MKVLVLGAGVIGVTSAWYLAKAGHDVSVIDRRADVALETSYGNAGGLCPSFAGPWAAPGMPLKAVKWMFQPSAPLKIRPKMNVHQWNWLTALVANCTRSKFQSNKATMQRIAHYSQTCLNELCQETALTFDNQSRGVLQIFQTSSELQNAHLSAAVLARLGVEHQIVDALEAKIIEPALEQSDVDISGGLFLPNDETGDSHIFCNRLVDLLKPMGVCFHFDTLITKILPEKDQITKVCTNRGDFEADAFVVALGPEVASMMRPLDIHLPVYPVKGYSITGHLLDNEPGNDTSAPRSSIMDEHNKIMVTRLGNRLRAAGFAEIAGFDKTLSKPAIASLIKSTKALFPRAINYDTCEIWTGFRPMTPDGPPRLGKTQYRNLYLNAGHGSNGWTQACGASKIVADIVSGVSPDIDVSGLTYLK